MLLQARAVSTDGLKPSFYTINIVVYVVQVKILLFTKFVYVINYWMMFDFGCVVAIHYMVARRKILCDIQ